MKQSDNIYLDQDDQTRIADNTVLNTNDDTVLSAQESMTQASEPENRTDKKSNVGAKVALGVGAAAVIGGVVAASAMSSGSDSSKSGLAPAATPDHEMTPEELQDSMATRTDPSQAPEPILHDDVVVTEETISSQSGAESAATSGASAAAHATHTGSVTSTGLEGAVLSDANPVGDVRTDSVSAANHDININITVNGQQAEVSVDEATPAATEQVEAQADVTEVTPEAVMIETPGGIRVAHVSDDVSFDQAFAQAREQVGPGGIFEYHGATYATYYDSEWEDMSNDAKAEFQTAAQIDVIDKEVEPEINVTSVGSHMMADGTVTNIATVQIDDINAVMIDADGDGVIDGAYVDANGDGQVQDNEIVDMSDTHLTMDDLANTMVHNDDMSALPDFDGDCQI